MEIENSQCFCNLSTDHDEILSGHADCGCKPYKKLNFAYLRNSIWWAAAIWEKIRCIFAIVRPITTKFCTNMYIGATNNAGCYNLHISKIPDGRRPPYCKSKIRNIFGTVDPNITTKFAGTCRLRVETVRKVKICTFLVIKNNEQPPC